MARQRWSAPGPAQEVLAPMREASFQTKRHARVERGIYKRQTADGVRYEFCFSDENGKTRWITVRTLKEARESVEREIVQDALRRHSGKIASAAIELGISRPTLYELMEKLGIGNK